MGEMGPARRLAEQMMNDLARLQCVATKRLTVYVELWFGRHPRAAGGFGFVQELIHLAGGANIFAERIEGFAKLDLAEVVRQRPEVVVVFWEADDQVVDVPALLQERGWTGRWPFRVVEAGIERGRNLIHDGPSILDTARWLRGQLQ
jgi:iron complex transport system substrate-binding protein